VSRVELASYAAADRDDYLRLLADAWGAKALTPAEFDWWFDGNPAGSLRSVARADDRVVGVAGHTLLRMRLAGEPGLATFSVHATTDPAFRGRGIFVDLERKHEREAEELGAAVALAFASAPTAPLFLGPLGWTRIARLRVWARPLIRRGGAPAGRAAPPAEDDAAAGWPNHVVRDPEHLEWRFMQSPKGYRIVGGEGGYAVVGHRVFRNRRFAYVADLVAPARAARGLLRRCLRAADGVGLLALPAPEHRAAYVSLGFFPIPWSLDFIGKALAGRLDTHPAAWRFTLGDADFF
jgi:GNAT superfamily N-acetyltransferase